MQIVINIEKKHLYFFVLLIALVGGSGLAFNSGGTGGVPNIMGHSFDEVGAGQANLGDVADETDSLRIYGNPVDGTALLKIEDSTPGDGVGDALDIIGDVYVDGYLLFKYEEPSSVNCAAEEEGSMIYNYGIDFPCFCDGTNWIKLSGGNCE